MGATLIATMAKRIGAGSEVVAASSRAKAGAITNIATTAVSSRAGRRTTNEASVTEARAPSESTISQMLASRVRRTAKAIVMAAPPQPLSHHRGRLEIRSAPAFSCGKP